MIGTNIVLPTNRWIKIELETVLNTPGMADGAALMWIDGDLIVKDTAITLRQDEKEKLNGVLAAASYRLVPPVPERCASRISKSAGASCGTVSTRPPFPTSYLAPHISTRCAGRPCTHRRGRGD